MAAFCCLFIREIEPDDSTIIISIKHQHEQDTSSMNEVTNALLNNLWPSDSISLSAVHSSCLKIVKNIDQLHAGIIAKDILNRQKMLLNAEFAKAAFFASDGEAGEQRLIDFIDCVSILPVTRFEAILMNHDVLAQDSISYEFDELGFLSIFRERFESAFLDQPSEGLFDYLTDGFSNIDWDALEAGEKKIDMAKMFPELFKKFGHLSEHSPPSKRSESAAKLKDLLGWDNISNV